MVNPAKNGRPCNVCTHPDKEAIQLALSAGKTTTTLSKAFDISTASLARCRAHHLQPSLVRAAERREELTMDGLIGKLQTYIERLERGMEKAETKDDLQGLSRCAKEAAAICVRLGQLKGSWSDRKQTTVDNRRLSVNLANVTDDQLRSMLQLGESLKLSP